MRSASAAPDLSSSYMRVSDTVSTAIFSGTNCLLSSNSDMSIGPGRGDAQKKLQVGVAESIAGGDRSFLEAGIEPALALRRGAVGKGIGHDIAARLFLQLVVADGRGRLQRCLDIARLDHFPALVGAMRPDAREAVGLQLDLDLQVIGLRLGKAALN